MPLGDLSSGRRGHFLPVLLSGAFAQWTDFQLADDFVLRDALVVQEHEFETQVLEALVVRNVENEAFVKYGTCRALFDVRLLLGDALLVVEEIDLHVGI